MVESKNPDLSQMSVNEAFY